MAGARRTGSRRRLRRALSFAGAQPPATSIHVFSYGLIQGQINASVSGGVIVLRAFTDGL